MNRHILTLSLVLGAHSLQANHQGRLVMQEDFIPTAVKGAPYAYQCVARGQDAAAYLYSCEAPTCALPAGMSVDPEGRITGTPEVSGAYPVTLHLRGSEGSIDQTVMLQAVDPAPPDSWCSRGHFGGEIAALGRHPYFDDNRTMYAAMGAGGLLKSEDGGEHWLFVPEFGSMPMADMFVDRCSPTPRIWAVNRGVPLTSSPSGPVNGQNYEEGRITVLRHDGPEGNVIEVNPGDFGGWPAGARRRITASEGACDGEADFRMLLSDDRAGVAFRDDRGAWNFTAGNNGLPDTGFPFYSHPVRDIQYGWGGSATTRSIAFALYDNPRQNARAVYMRRHFDAERNWVQCADLSELGEVAGTWTAMAISPDGWLIAATDRGVTAIADVRECDPDAPNKRAVVSRGPGFKTVGGPASGFAVNRFRFPPCPNGADVFAATDAGLFYSRDFTATEFERVSSGLLNEEVNDLAFGPGACGEEPLVLGTRREGIAGGRAGAPMCHTPLAEGAAFDRIAPTAAFTSEGIANQCEGGQAPGGLFAAGGVDGLFRAARGGREFYPAGDTREKVLRALSATVDERSRVYAASQSGVYAGESDGVDFSDYRFTAEPIERLAPGVDPAEPRMWAASSNRLYASSTAVPFEKRADWSIESLTEFGCSGPITDLQAGGRLTGPFAESLWVICGDSLLFSLDYDKDADRFVAAARFQEGRVARLAVSRRDGERIVLFVQESLGEGRYRYRVGQRSEAGGAVLWNDFRERPVGLGLPTDEPARQLVVEPSPDPERGQLFALFARAGVFRSDDGGNSFAPLAGAGLPPGLAPAQLELARDYAGTDPKLRGLALLADGRGVYLSNDGGDTFCPGPARVNKVPGKINAIGTSAFSNNVLMTTTDEGVFVTEDGGASWRNRSPSIARFTAVMAHPLDAAREIWFVAEPGGGILASDDLGLRWSRVHGSGSVTAFADDPVGCAHEIVATLSDGAVLKSVDDGASWATQSGPVDGAAVDRAPGSVCAAGKGRGPRSAAGSSASYWMVGSSSGASFSETGSVWTPANGGNDYQLPAVAGYQSVKLVAGAPGHVAVGHATLGLFVTRDGGDTWRNVTGAGSGLEATSKNVSTLITATTPSGTTDLLAGVNGTTTGGVYLSGDGGSHWTQVNQGFDPNSLSISTLVKSSCAGCPVQYYTGSYGGGLYTRTITVTPAPSFAPGANYACFGSTNCACSTASSEGPVSGGVPFKICGANFQNGAIVEFDGIPASGCIRIDAATITCSGTPPHVAGAATVRVRNPDTRSGTLPGTYLYAGGVSRASTARISRSGSNVWVSWLCGGACTAGSPARVYRAQNAAFTQYLETFNGGAGGTRTGGCTPAPGADSCHSQPGAFSTSQSYFWVVE